MVLLSQESVQMGGAPQVGAALLRVLQHGYTQHWTLNNAQSLSSVWCLPQVTHFFFSRNRNVQNLGQEQEQDLHYQRELKMKTTQTSILQFSERRQLKKIYKHLYILMIELSFLFAAS